MPEEKITERMEVEKHVRAYTRAWQTNNNEAFRREMEWLWSQGISDLSLIYDREGREFFLPDDWKPASNKREKGEKQ
jgi:hypothetical protein